MPVEALSAVALLGAHCLQLNKLFCVPCILPRNAVESLPYLEPNNVRLVVRACRSSGGKLPVVCSSHSKVFAPLKRGAYQHPVLVEHIVHNVLASVKKYFVANDQQHLFILVGFRQIEQRNICHYHIPEPEIK
jgi:hypothetical protein